MCNRLKILLWCLCTVAGIPAGAQSGFEETDAAAERMFYDSQWSQLAAFGKEAEKKGFDYFSMNYRTGVACYMLGRYSAAEHFLRKAMSQNNTQDAVNYLYNTLLAQGRDLEAAVMKKKYRFIKTGITKQLPLS